MGKIRVLVVDDQRIVRLSLSTFIRAFEDLEAVGEAINGQEGVELCAKLQPDVVLMDVRMPDMDGIAATRLIHQVSPTTQVVLLTALPLQEVSQAAIEVGVSSYLLKNSGIAEIAEAIRQAASGAQA